MHFHNKSNAHGIVWLTMECTFVSIPGLKLSRAHVKNGLLVHPLDDSRRPRVFSTTITSALKTLWWRWSSWVWPIVSCHLTTQDRPDDTRCSCWVGVLMTHPNLWGHDGKTLCASNIQVKLSHTVFSHILVWKYTFCDDSSNRVVESMCEEIFS